jgi:hypothetical protein
MVTERENSMLRIAATLLVVLASLTGCSSAPSAAGDASLDVTIRGSQITPNAERIPLGVGKTFTLNVDTDRDATIHVHSTPEQEYNVAPGTTPLKIVIDKPGTVQIEEHQNDIVIATLEVQ